jgi:PAS domain S-box-containing protein
MKEGALDYLTKSNYLKSELNIKVEKVFQLFQERTRTELALKDSEERFRSIFEIANAGIFFSDKNGQIVLVNKILRNILGYSFKELYHMNFNEFTDDYDLNQENELFNDLINKKINQYRIEKRYVCKSGELKWVDLAMSVIRDSTENPQYFIGVVNDITERKLYEQQLKDINLTKDKFFSIIAHDIRGQFSIICGLSELLINKKNTINESEQEKFISLLNESGKSALTLLEELLEWSRSQINRLEFIPKFIDLQLLINEVMTVVINQAALKNIEIVCNIEYNTQIYADKNMISTVLRNLLNNAIKFTRKGGQVYISNSTQEDFDTIFVRDSGVGMTQKVIDNLFRLEASHFTEGTANEKGTGLGLILCGEFIEKHGGKIKVESEMNAGSTFIVSLPKK